MLVDRVLNVRSAVGVVEANEASPGAGPEDKAHRQTDPGKGNTHKHVEQCSLGLYVVRSEILGANFGLTVVEGHLFRTWMGNGSSGDRRLFNRVEVHCSESIVVEAVIGVEF